MKSILFCITGMLFFTANAQFMGAAPNTNDKFIEVKVSDTMMVNPDMVMLMVSIAAEDASTAYWDSEKEEDSEEAERKMKNDEIQKKKAIEEVLRKNNIPFKFHEKKSGKKDLFSKDLSLYENAYEATIKNEAVLEKVKKELSAIENVDTKVTESKIADKEKYELQLVDRVMKKAEREASVIAKAMGVVLDKPLNVSNQSADNMYSSMFNNPESMGGMGALFSMMGNMFKASAQTTQVTISKSLVVRYGIK